MFVFEEVSNIVIFRQFLSSKGDITNWKLALNLGMRYYIRVGEISENWSS